MHEIGSEKRIKENFRGKITGIESESEKEKAKNGFPKRRRAPLKNMIDVSYGPMAMEKCGDSIGGFLFHAFPENKPVVLIEFSLLTWHNLKRKKILHVA